MEEDGSAKPGSGRGLHLQVMSHQAASLDGPFGEVWEKG